MPELRENAEGIREALDGPREIPLDRGAVDDGPRLNERGVDDEGRRLNDGDRLKPDDLEPTLDGRGAVRDGVLDMLEEGRRVICDGRLADRDDRLVARDGARYLEEPALRAEEPPLRRVLPASASGRAGQEINISAAAMAMTKRLGCLRNDTRLRDRVWSDLV
jgi:hypothetical protein